jgi:hypothetical protein
MSLLRLSRSCGVKNTEAFSATAQYLHARTASWMGGTYGEKASVAFKREMDVLDVAIVP